MKRCFLGITAIIILGLPFEMVCVDPARSANETFLKESEALKEQEIKKKELEEQRKKREIDQKEADRKEFVRLAESVKDNKPLVYEDLMKKAAKVEKELDQLGMEKLAIEQSKEQLQKDYTILQTQLESLLEVPTIEATRNKEEKLLKESILYKSSDDVKNIVWQNIPEIEKGTYDSQLRRLQSMLESLTSRFITPSLRENNPLQDEINYIGQRVADIKEFQKNKPIAINKLAHDLKLQDKIAMDQLNLLNAFLLKNISFLADGLRENNINTIKLAIDNLENIKAIAEHKQYQLKKRRPEMIILVDEFIQNYQSVPQKENIDVQHLSKIQKEQTMEVQAPALLTMNDASIIEGLQVQANQETLVNNETYAKALEEDPELKMIVQNAKQDLGGQLREISDDNFKKAINAQIASLEQVSPAEQMTQIDAKLAQIDSYPAVSSDTIIQKGEHASSIAQSIKRFFSDITKYLQNLLIRKSLPTIEEAHQRYNQEKSNYLKILGFVDGESIEVGEITNRISSNVKSNPAKREEITKAHKDLLQALSDLQKTYQKMQNGLAVTAQAVREIVNVIGADKFNKELDSSKLSLSDIWGLQKNASREVIHGLSDLKNQLADLKKTSIARATEKYLKDLSRLLMDAQVENIAAEYAKTQYYKSALEEGKKRLEKQRGGV